MQLLSYNVANFANSLNYGNFVTFINKYDIFFLYETHVLAEKQHQFSSNFKNYSLHWVPAQKKHKAGRAIGGCLYGFRKELQKKYKLRFLTISNHALLTITLHNTTFNLVPVYLNCTNWKAEYDLFFEFLRELNPTNFCLLGDFNARIGEYQQIDYNIAQNFPHLNENRISKDKELNYQGKRLLDLVGDYGGIVLNGRCGNDLVGEFTFCGVMGSSVIDYAICSYSFLQYLADFKISTKPYSDHMPLCLHIKISHNSSGNTETAGFQKLRWDNKLLNTYTEKLSIPSTSNLCPVNTSVDELVNNITYKISQAALRKPNRSFFEPKQEWFDWQCARARNCMMKWLCVQRKNHNAANKTHYLTARAKYIQLCKSKKLEFYNKTLDKLNWIKDSKGWWRLAKSLSSSPKNVMGELTADDFHLHFSSMLQYDYNSQLIYWSMPYFTDAILDSPIEFCELDSVLRGLKHDKAPGKDGICYEFYKYAPVGFINEILSVLNRIFLNEEIPNSFRDSIIIPIFKKGDPNCPQNYRGLSLMDTLGKIFNTIILNRVNEWIEDKDILNEYQAGFRKQYSTVDNIFNLVNIVHLNKLNGKKTYALFVDFSCAFDMIPRNCLFYKLSCLGLSTKIIRIIQNSYSNTCSTIWDGSSMSKSFSVEMGVKQGCILSPLLFTLYINDLADALPGGVEVAGVRVKVLLYADDIVILSDSPSGLQNMINALHQYCLTWSLKVNLDKSKVLIFRTGTRVSSNLKWNYGDDDIQIVNNYKYLGVNIAYNLSFKMHLNGKLSSSKMAINSTWSEYINNPAISIANKLKIFNAASTSIMFYAAQVWGYTKYDEVEKLFRFFMKKMLNLPNNTPNYLLHLETGLDSLYISTLKLHFAYINKVLQLPSYRLPRVLAAEILEKKTYWAEEWLNISRTLQYSSDNSNRPLCAESKQILNLLCVMERNDAIVKAKSSQFHDLYSHLNYDISSHYYAPRWSTRATSIIIRARGGLLNINARAFKSNTIGLCTICNLDQSENTFHFIGVCPIYNNTRLRYFGKVTLDANDVIDLLNGQNFRSLYNYLENCIKYRNLILNEFN